MPTATGVSLVPLGRAHLARTRAWANDADISRLMGRARPVSEDEHEAWFASLEDRADCAYFAIETAAQHVGNVWLWGIDRRHRKAELRIVVGEPSARERGVGSQAVDLMCRYGFDHFNLNRIYAYVLSINPRGRRAFEKAGFAVEGTLREDRWTGSGYVDVYLLARLATS